MSSDLSGLDFVVDWDGIPESDLVPAGKYTLRVRDWEERRTGDGRLMLNGYFDIEEGLISGVSFPIMSYVLGSQQDPDGKDPLTQKVVFGWRELNKCLGACGAAKQGTLEARLQQARGRLFQATVSVQEQRSGGYAGTQRNRIGGYFGINEPVPQRGQPGLRAVQVQSQANPDSNDGRVQPRQRQGNAYERPPTWGAATGGTKAEDDIPF